MTDDPDDQLVQRSVALVAEWVEEAAGLATVDELTTTTRLARLVEDPAGVAFAMSFVDRVIRSEDVGVSAQELASLVRRQPLPGFLSRFDRLLLRGGALIAPVLPRLVVPLARRRMRQLVGHLVVDAHPQRLRRHLAQRQRDGYKVNVNVLGEAVLGQREAQRRFDTILALLGEPDIDYVSVKLSALVPRLNHWDHEHGVAALSERLRVLFGTADRTAPPTFVNLDMEEYHDLEVTLRAFMEVLDEPDFRRCSAGIVLQAYLPDSAAALQRLVAWAAARRAADRATGGAAGQIKVRLVKGANLAMERVEAAMRGWAQAPYGSKAEADANYKRCLDWLLTPERTDAVRVGVASHNLFDIASALLLAEARGVADRVEVEMLEGMAPTYARLLQQHGQRPLMYTPVVAAHEFDVAISYLFRRLEENASKENFIRHLLQLRPGSPAFDHEAERFRRAVADRLTVDERPRRLAEPPVDVVPGTFANEPDSDPVLAPTRVWAAGVIAGARAGVVTPAPVADVAAVDAAVERAVAARRAWAAQPATTRRAVLHSVAAEMASRRGELVAAMIAEGRKTIGEADVEVSEAIDFARWYGDRAVELQRDEGAEFVPFGVVAVAPPWNFPLAIAAGGVLASLAAGNAVVLKPAPETPRCAELVAECCWVGGVPRGALEFVNAPDDERGRRVITHPAVEAVILTGAMETADMFRSWRPDLRLFAETSGKNAIIITPSADIDLAVADLVASAFGHSGQKCSAASLAICVGQTYESSRLRRQLLDAVTSLTVGAPTDLGTDTGPLIGSPSTKLLRGLTQLDAAETWLVEPRRVADDIWSPGVRLGVQRGSWFHHNECFGPVLGVMRAATLDEAIELQNMTAFGLTGGIHSLDPDEIERWADSVQVGNAYVNRTITGAIVRRQPFGGWKRSVVGPGAKAGGPNYVGQLGEWRPHDEARDDAWLAAAERSDAAAWRDEFAVSHDPTGLFCESNAFRYRPLARIAVRVETSASPAAADATAASPASESSGGGAVTAPDTALDVELRRVLAAARRCGVEAIVSTPVDESSEQFAVRLPALGVERVRVLGEVTDALRDAANEQHIHLAADPVTRDGRVELLHYLREQVVTRTLHRYGNLIAAS